MNVHWRRLVKKLMRQTQIWGANSGKTDKCFGVSQLLRGARARAAPQNTQNRARSCDRGPDNVKIEFLKFIKT